jgi:large subunit ribosomal protein L4
MPKTKTKKNPTSPTTKVGATLGVNKIKSKKVNAKALTMKMYGLQGQELTPVELPKDIFSTKVNENLLAQAVRVYQINQRQGTASTKTRGEVIGSTRKIYKQKGTGKARHGDIKAPIFVGGGVVGGPKPRNFIARINKKQRKIAVKYALTLKAKTGDILGIANDFEKIEPKTKIMAAIFKKIDCYNRKTLIVLPKITKDNFIFATRNIPKISIIDALSLNPFLILNSNKIIFREDSLKILVGHLSNEN